MLLFTESFGGRESLTFGLLIKTARLMIDRVTPLEACNFHRLQRIVGNSGAEEFGACIVSSLLWIFSFMVFTTSVKVQGSMVVISFRRVGRKLMIAYGG